MRNPSCGSSSTTPGTCRTSCCSNKVGIKRGPWTPEEDEILAEYINREGVGRWRTLPSRAGLLRCGKSCRLRWMNYLRPSVKRGRIAPDEEDLILRLHRLLGNRWALIAGRIPGRTDNEIKNYWNTHLSKKLIKQGIDPRTHKPLNPNYHSNGDKPNYPPSNGFPTYSSAANPNYQSSMMISNLPLKIINQSYDQTLPRMTNLEEIMDKSTPADHNLITSQPLMSNHPSNNRDPNRELNKHDVIAGCDPTTGSDQAEVFGSMDYYDDHMFSSILNSLIDEHVFANHQF